MHRILSVVHHFLRPLGYPGAGLMILGLAFPSLCGAQAGSSTQCLASDTTNLMYADTAGCSPEITGQPTPPPDGTGLSWLNPNYNSSTAGGWSNAVSVNYLAVGNWGAPCSISGSGPGAWIGWDGNGDNPCGPTSANVANLFFLKSFNVPAGCSVSQATLLFQDDNYGYVWLNGNSLASDTGAYNACTSLVVSPGYFQTGTNMLEIEDVNSSSGGGYYNYQGFDYDFCYILSCPVDPTPTSTPTSTFTSTPTVTPTPSLTPTPALTPTPSATPTATPTLLPNSSITPTPTSTSCPNQLLVSTNVFRPLNQEKVGISVTTCASPGDFFLRIYNSAGEHIRTLDSESIPAGFQATYSWDGTNKYGNACASGVYIILFEYALGTQTARVVLVR